MYVSRYAEIQMLATLLKTNVNDNQKCYAPRYAMLRYAMRKRHAKRKKERTQPTNERKKRLVDDALRNLH